MYILWTVIPKSTDLSCLLSYIAINICKQITMKDTLSYMITVYENCCHVSHLDLYSQTRCANQHDFYLIVSEKLGPLTWSALGINFQCWHQPKIMLEQFCLYSQAGEHFPFYNSFPRCTVILKHAKTEHSAFKYASGQFPSIQVYGIACLLKESCSAFNAASKLSTVALKVWARPLDGQFI